MEEYACYKCSMHLDSLNEAIMHLKTHDFENGELLKCMKIQISCDLFCTSSFQSFKTLRKHMHGTKCLILCSDVHTDGENAAEWNLIHEFSGLLVEEQEEEKSAASENVQCSGNFAAFIENFIDKNKWLQFAT